MNLLNFWPFKAPPSLAVQVEHGREAKDLWENPAFKRAMVRIKDGIHERWEASAILDRDGQHELRLLLKLLNDVEGNIRNEMSNGVMAEATIKHEAETERRRKEPIQFRR